MHQQRSLFRISQKGKQGGGMEEHYGISSLVAIGCSRATNLVPSLLSFLFSGTSSPSTSRCFSSSVEFSAISPSCFRRPFQVIEARLLLGRQARFQFVRRFFAASIVSVPHSIHHWWAQHYRKDIFGVRPRVELGSGIECLLPLHFTSSCSWM